jgi:hypothetical protein
MEIVFGSGALFLFIAILLMTLFAPMGPDDPDDPK